MFVYSPETIDVTLTWIVHVEAGGILALLILTVLSPGSALNDAEPPQLDSDADTGLASTRLLGRSSVKDACVKVNSESLFRIRIAN